MNSYNPLLPTHQPYPFLQSSTTMHAMISTGITLLSALVLYFIYSRVQSLRKNIKIAKGAGLPYVVVPFSFRALPWKVAHRLFRPILCRLPEPKTSRWLQIRMIQRIWHEGYTPFANIGSDTFITVYPTRILVWTCEPEVVVQVCGSRKGFEKPLAFMDILNIHGPTVAATDGEESRLYRRTAQPSINPNTHATVWNHMLEQAGELMDLWMGSEDGRPNNLPRDIARLTTHVLSYAAYGKRMSWNEGKGVCQRLKESGHSLTYGEAIQSSLDRMVTICMTPRWLLKYSPFAVHKKAYEAFVEFRKYMEEMRDEKRAEIIAQGASKHPNLLGALVQASRFPSYPQNNKRIDQCTLSDEAVIGNIYIFLLAGHETSANTLVYALTLMACFPEKQKLLQAELDWVLGDRPSNTWTYEEDFAALKDGYIGAIMAEVVRIFGITPAIPKRSGSKAEIITRKSQQICIPPRTVVMVNTSALHRNPKYWPMVTASNRIKGERPPYPASTFKPEFWFNSTEPMTAAEARGGRRSHKPVAGSYIPFSAGSRPCMGKRFAQANFCAAMAYIFKYYKVKLNVEGPKRNNDGQKAWVYARSVAMRELSEGTDFFTTLKMNKGVPLKFEKRKL